MKTLEYDLHRVARQEPRTTTRLLRSMALVPALRAKFVVQGPKFRGSRCWVWSAATTSRGYGSVWDRGSSRQAHLVVYEVAMRNGRKLRGKKRELDHLCRNRLCVNPAHMEPVTRGVNNRRSTCWHHLVKASRTSRASHPGAPSETS